MGFDIFYIYILHTYKYIYESIAHMTCIYTTQQALQFSNIKQLNYIEYMQKQPQY